MEYVNPKPYICSKKRFMIYPIVAYGNPILKKRADEIEKGSIDVKQLAEDMFETMHNAQGIGLAAPQIGKSIRMFVVDGAPLEEEETVDFGFKQVLLPAERALILGHAREAGVESVVELELATPRPLSEIVSGIADEQRRRDLYVLAFTIVRADETVTGGERVYLAQLAHQLGLDPATAAALEAQTASQIDATPESDVL